MSEILNELTSATKVKRKKDEAEVPFFKRLGKAVGKLDDDAWGALSEAAKDYHNAVCTAFEENAGSPKIPPPPDAATNGAAYGADPEPVVLEASGDIQPEPPQEKAPKEKKAKKAKVKDEAKEAETTEEKRRGRAARYADNFIITRKVVTNPHREGSKRAQRWPLFRDGMTVKEARAAGFNLEDLYHGVRDEQIEVSAP